MPLCLAPTIPVSAELGYDEGGEPTPPTPFPAAFKDYQILPHTISPDQQHALIYPKRSRLYDLARADLFLAALKPFDVLTALPLGNSNLADNDRCYYAAQWARDSTSVRFIAGIRWGPGTVVVIRLRGGKIASFTDLTSEVRREVSPDFYKSHAARYNEYYDFVFDREDRASLDKEGRVIRENGWDIDEHGQVIVDCTCTTDPKDLDPHRWAVHFKGAWNIKRGKFTRKSLTRVPFKPEA